jgi:hypothetical protein
MAGRLSFPLARLRQRVDQVSCIAGRAGVKAASQFRPVSSRNGGTCSRRLFGPYRDSAHACADWQANGYTSEVDLSLYF